MANHRVRLLPLILAMAATAGETAPRRIGANPCRTGEIIEWELPPGGRIDLEVDALPRLRLTPDGGDDPAVTVPGFAYRPCTRRADGSIVATGPVRPRFRHRFAAPGRYRVALLDTAGAAIAAGVDVTVAAGTKPPGPLRISPHNPLLLAWADGTPFVPIGLNLCWATGDDPLATQRRMLATFANHGGNHVRLWLSSWFGQVEGDDARSYRLDHAWLVDQVLADAHARGLAVTLVLDNHHDIVLGKSCPYGVTAPERLAAFFAVPLHPDYAQRLRYLLARYAAFDHILAWELCNEIDLTGLAPEPARAWTTAAAAALRDRDPYGHLRTISQADARWADLAALPGIDLAQIHQYVPYLPKAVVADQDSYVRLLDHQLPAMRRGKPFCFAEVGHHGTNEDNPGNDLDRTGVLLRQQAWGGFLVGGYGTGMNWWWDVYIDRFNLWPAYRPLADVISRIDWRDPELRPYRPPPQAELRLLGWQSRDQALFTAVPWGDTWYTIVVDQRHPSTAEFHRRGVVIADLRPAQDFSMTGIAAATGQVLRQESHRSDTSGRLLLQLNPDHPEEIITLIRTPTH